MEVFGDCLYLIRGRERDMKDMALCMSCEVERDVDRCACDCHQREEEERAGKGRCLEMVWT